MRNPIYTVIAGPNGSGKSTLIQKLEESGTPLNNYYNADDIARAIEGEDRDEINRHTQELVQRARTQAIMDRQGFSYETVMSHSSHVDMMEEALRQGFLLYFGFVTTDDPDINVARVATRVANGGHHVAPATVRRRYVKVMSEQMPRAIRIASRAFIFDNSYANQPSRLILELNGDEADYYDYPDLAWPETYLLPALKDRPGLNLRIIAG